MNVITDRPVAIGGAVTTLITAVLPILVALGVSSKIVEIVGFSVPSIVVAIGTLVHSLVTPTSKLVPLPPPVV